jgi:hypothetical protein
MDRFLPSITPDEMAQGVDASNRNVVGDLRGRDLRWADLRGAQVHADLSGADLRWANFEGAEMFCTLDGADLRGANLKGFDIKPEDVSADFRGAEVGRQRPSSANAVGALHCVVRYDHTVRWCYNDGDGWRKSEAGSDCLTRAEVALCAGCEVADVVAALGDGDIPITSAREFIAGCPATPPQAAPA